MTRDKRGPHGGWPLRRPHCMEGHSSQLTPLAAPNSTLAAPTASLIGKRGMAPASDAAGFLMEVPPQHLRWSDQMCGDTHMPRRLGMGVPGPPFGEGRLVIKKLPQTWEGFRTRDEETDRR